MDLSTIIPLSTILERFHVILLTIPLMVGLQSFGLFFGMIVKKAIPPMPLLETLLRPLIVFLCNKLNRAERTDFALFIRGIVSTAFVLFLVFGIVYLLPRSMIYVDVALLMLILSPLSAIPLARWMAKDRKPPQSVYLYISHALNRNITHLDDYGLKRAGVTLLNHAMIVWVLAPVILYGIGGIYLAYGFVVLSLFCRVVGVSSPFVAIHKILVSILLFPVWIEGIVLTFTASIFSSGGRPLATLSSAQSFLNAESIYAYALGITLGGAYQNRDGETVKMPWSGSEKSSAKIEKKNVIQAIMLYSVSLFLFCAFAYASFILFSVMSLSSTLSEF